MSWCVLGDFNPILNSYDKFDVYRFQINQSIRGFHDFVRNYDLMDPGFFGSKYTWYNNCKGHARISVRLACVFDNST